MFIIKAPQQNSKKWYMSKSLKNMFTPTASNRFSTSKGVILTLIETMIAKSYDKVCDPQYEVGQYRSD